MVNSFTINQTPDSQNAFFYPNADTGKKQLTAFGEASNYACVDDDRSIPDEDSTYVYTAGISVVTDIYALPNHTTETGTINYVKVFARAKSQTYAQSPSGIYKILASTSAATYHSDDINLTTDYTVYNNTWATNPADSAAWAWTDIDNLKIGVACSSPTAYGLTKNLTLRPTACGSLGCGLQNVGAVGAACVNEATPDGWTTYVYNSTGAGEESHFAIPNHTTETGVINSVAVYIVAICWGGGTPRTAYCFVREGATTTYSELFTLTDAWTTYSHTWTAVPTTAAAWAWADIDALEVGVWIDKCLAPNYGYCTQVYAVVNYTETSNPQIRTTQNYAVVNYTPSSSTCYLNLPTDYSFESNYELQKRNWWNDTRTTRVLRRSAMSVSMSGFEFNTATSTATTRLACVEDMKDNGSPITLSGLADPNLNSTWIISDFNYNISSNNPNLWYWNMTLEKDA